MEKFAVDLEKVLNEFEYNEERRESGPASSARTTSNHDTLGSLRQPPPLPATIYRKPSFERINLADANFAASPPKSTGLHHGLYERQNENSGSFSYLSKPQALNNRNYVQVNDSLEPTLSNDAIINNKQVILESEESPLPSLWQKPTVHTDEKPDLLENNSNTAVSDSNNIEVRSQLPDITTFVRTSSNNLNNNVVEHLSNSLDLISSTNTTLLTEANKTIEKEESGLTSRYSTLKEEVLVEDSNNVITPAIDCLSEVGLTSSDNIIPYETDHIESEQYSEEPHAPHTTDDDSVVSKKAKNESHRVYNVDSNGNSEADVNRGSSFECEVINSSEDKTDISDSCGRLSDYANNKSVIGFGQNEDYSQSQLLEYLERVDKEFDENVVESIPSSETLPNVINHSDYSEKIESEDIIKDNSNHTLMIGDEENAIDLSNITLLPVGSSQLTSVSGEYLSANSSYQNVQNEILSHQSNSEPQRKDVNVNFERTRLGEAESSEQGSAIELDHSKDYDIVKQQADSLQFDNSIVSSTIQAEKVKSSNPFDEDDCDSSITESESKTMNPFEHSLESNSKNPFESDSGNPFEDDFEESIDEEDSSLEVTSQSTLQKIDKISVESISKNASCNNESAFGKVSSVDSVNVNSTVGVETVDTDLNPPQISNSSSSSSSKQTSLEPDTTTNINVSEEIPSTDCSPSGSSLDGEPFDSSSMCSARMIPIRQAVESSSGEIDEAGVPAEEDRPMRPNSLELPQRITVESSSSQSNDAGLERETGLEDRRLGKIAPFWIPDTDTTMCMQCQLKFNVIRRRHHCRACGQVLCNKCCGLKARLEYMDFEEARVCQPCFTILEAVSASESTSPQRRRPNPNNPMEYCSTIPPLQQVAGSMHKHPPSVMVPVGVLKREGRSKSEVTKQVMFSDGIRPGGDLTELDGSTEPRMPFRRSGRLTKRVGTPPGGVMSPGTRRVMDSVTHSFIPSEGDSCLPPVITRHQGEVSYVDLESPVDLNQPVIKFALNRNLFVTVKRVLLDCCVNRECWCFCSEGLACVGQDEIVFLLECLPQEVYPPKDVFLLINLLYQDAAKGSTVSEMSFTPATSNNLLGSRDHGGFLYIRTSYQCTAQLVLPSPPYLVALLIHRWETPWARLFPMRLMLRLGAEFRYYPCPLVSVRNRPPLYTDIGHTIINILADFRKYSYTLPSVRGLVIHMEDRQTTINIPRNRYDQVVRALKNSDDSVLAFGANLSLAADSHLVCMQSAEDENTSYHTQAININNKPRKVTGASFVVFNGALKVPGLAGKSNIVEDGLMVQVPSETMAALRSALRDMQDYSIGCGPNAEETVLLQWTADDTNFNIGVKSCIDGKPLDGVPSIRVHNGTDYSGGLRLIRWTEVFILQCEDSDHTSEPLDISRLSESIARATCLALVPLLDLLSAATLTTLAVRTTIHPDNVGYEAGSNGEKLPPLYMKSLDDELVAVVHQALVSQENPAVLELVFRIMEQG